MTRRRWFSLFLALSAGSLLVMTVVDYLMGPEAEFLNAWSVIERLAGLPPTVDSLAYRELGAPGELICVLLANMIIGALLALLIIQHGNSREHDIDEQ